MIKDFLKRLAIYALVVMAGSLLYVLLFRTPLLMSVTVYLYRALSIVAVVGVIVTAVLLIIHKKIRFIELDGKDVALSITLLLSFLILLNSIVMVSLDRSISVFILSDMAQNSEKTFTAQEIEQRFLNIYVKENGAMEQRFEEQIISKNVKETDGGFQITERGKFLVEVFRLLGKIIPVDGKSLYPPPLA